MPAALSRRSLLRAGGLGVSVALLAACTSGSSDQPPPSPPTPDEAARSAAARLEVALADQARRTAQRHPTLTVAVVAAAAHTAHADALHETLSATAAPTPSPTSPAARPEPVIPATRKAAAAELATAEDAAGTSHRKALAASGVTGELARLLASVAASDESFGAAVRTQGAS